ncbi:alpha-amylase-like [Patiria miniata]|uniref:Alpha-amylase n=1 Tax=Patiria miniata TaxID=46514 RepID=A0A914ASD1_PATMI|nr:alpha-amylase-like [Patiria miniata]
MALPVGIRGICIPVPFLEMRTLCLLVILIGSALGQWDANTAYDRQAMVHLFEWKWTDIADECERYLAPNGFGGVQISPPSEHREVWSPWRPWWERYQPVSYKLTSRSGTESELRDMVMRCNNVGVRIYVDAVINHMGSGDTGYGTAGSYYDASAFSFPGVPFASWDFNVANGKCNSNSGDIESYQDVNQVRNCNLVSLRDLDTSKSYVRSKIVEFMNTLIDIGVAGFRVDACKHMWPGDLGAMFGSLNNLNTAYFPAGSRALIFQEVIDQGGEPITAGEYTPYGRVTEFKYGLRVGEAMNGANKLSYFSNFGEAWGMLADGSALVFVDNHDNQRGHGGGGSIITHESPRLYKMANAFMLAFPYGFARVMSSFDFNHDTDAGPPADGNGNTQSVTINADGTCGGGWVCEHRWRQIKNMIGFRNVAAGQPLSNWWSNGNQQIAFGRGDKAFIAINNDGYTLSETLYTGMPSGEYCNLILGDFDSSSSSCSGPTIHVDGSGNAYFNVDTGDDPVAAIHVSAKVGDSSSSPSNPVNPVNPVDPGSPVGYQRTVIFIKKQTIYGQDLFIRGGIDHNKRSGCTSNADTSACALPISHNIGGTNGQFNAWSSGDDFLDWYGAEGDQSTYQGSTPDGTPLVWTTNNPSNGANVQANGYGYTPLNKWGDHYWMVDVDMDCDQTEGSWFEVKAYLKNGAGWEGDIGQGSCSGSSSGSKPYSSNNHFARCGYLNVFEFGSSSCTMESL